MFKYVLVKDLPNSESNIHANKSVLFYVLQSENNVMDTSCFYQIQASCSCVDSNLFLK